VRDVQRGVQDLSFLSGTLGRGCVPKVPFLFPVSGPDLEVHDPTRHHAAAMMGG